MCVCVYVCVCVCVSTVSHRSTTEHTSIRSVVSSEALEASERARASLHEEVTRLHAALVQQRLRHSRARLAFVAYYACVREGALLRACVAHWRAAVADAKVLTSYTCQMGLHALPLCTFLYSVFFFCPTAR